MANQSSNPPPGAPEGPPAGGRSQPGELAGAATVMAEAPEAGAAPRVADQKTAILDPRTPEGAALQAPISAASEARGAAAWPSSAAPIADQKTAILDPGSASLQAVQAQIAQARARAAPAAGDPARDQRTVILESPPTLGRAGLGAPPPVAPPGPIAELKTAILDPGSAAAEALQAQIAAGRARAAASEAAAGHKTIVYQPPAAAPLPPPVASAMGAQHRTATMKAPLRVPGAGPAARLPAPRRRLPVRWFLGPAITLLTAGATFAAAGVLMPRRPVIPAPPPPPAPPPAVIGRIHLETTPPGASVTLDGRPHPRFTPTDIEGPVGETATHVVVKLDGYQPSQQDVLFTRLPQRLVLALNRVDRVEPPPRPAGHGAGSDSLRGGSSRHPTAGGGSRRALDDGIEALPDKGTLAIRADAAVIVDGQVVGRGPIGSITLSPGRHTIELVNDKLGKRERLHVEVRPGENPPIVRAW